MTLRLLASASAFYFWVQPYDLAAYVALLRGLDLPFAGIDLYLDANPAAALPAFDDASRRYLAELELRAVHIDLFRFDWRTAVDEAQLSAALRYVGQFARDVEATHLVVHGEFLGRDAEERCARMRAALPEGVVLAAELVAEGGCYATHPDHLERALAADPELQLVPDTAHMQDFDYPWQQVFLNPTLRARICMVHTSNHARHLGESLYGDTREGREAVHALCIADEGRFPPDYLRELRRYPLVLEGIVPRGAEGVELLRREVAFLTGAAAREEGP